MKILALDLSLTATGFATTYPVFNDADRVQRDVHSGTIEPRRMSGMPRLRYIRDLVLSLARDADVVVLEGYAFGVQRQAGARAIGELGGVVRLALFEAERPVAEVPPASLKLFACGAGNAAKDAMLASAIRQLGYEGHDHNVSDALFLLAMGRCAYGLDVPSNAHQRRALEKIQWPAARVSAAVA